MSRCRLSLIPGRHCSYLQPILWEPERMSFLHTLFLIGTELIDKNSQVLDGSRTVYGSVVGINRFALRSDNYYVRWTIITLLRNFYFSKYILQFGRQFNCKTCHLLSRNTFPFNLVDSNKPTLLWIEKGCSRTLEGLSNIQRYTYTRKIIIPTLHIMYPNQIIFQKFLITTTINFTTVLIPMPN